MKKAIVLLMCLLTLLFCACTVNIPSPTPNVIVGEPTPQTEEPTGAEDITEDITQEPEESGDITQEPDETPAASPTPEGPKMYSSYAHLKSYDPARGLADFDYFDMLRGDEAVAHLVSQGWSQDEAQSHVDDFADSEFVEKNTNKQLRTIDLREVQLKLMCHPDGTKVEGADPIDATLEDFYNLYHVNPALIKDEYFYYITVTDGEVVCVEQVYWP